MNSHYTFLHVIGVIVAILYGNVNFDNIKFGIVYYYFNSLSFGGRFLYTMIQQSISVYLIIKTVIKEKMLTDSFRGRDLFTLLDWKKLIAGWRRQR